jgi:hypothetical protein
MQDRPTAVELLREVERFLREDAAPNLGRLSRYYALVSANAVRAVARELEMEEGQLLEEWEGLNSLLGPQERPSQLSRLREAVHRRTEELCQRIRAGEADEEPYRQQMLEYLRRMVRHKLLVNDPGWLERSDKDASR